MSMARRVANLEHKRGAGPCICLGDLVDRITTDANDAPATVVCPICGRQREERVLTLIEVVVTGDREPA